MVSAATAMGPERATTSWRRSILSYYDPKRLKEKRSEQMTARIPKSVKAGLEMLARIWTEMDRAGGEDVEWSVADVANHLLAIGLEGSWAELGTAPPKTEEQFQQVMKAALKHIHSGKK